MKQIKIALVGASGKMGKEIQKTFSAEAQFKIIAKIGRNDKLDDISPGKIDLIIDFSTVESFRKTLRYCEENQIPLIGGVTGLSKADFAQMKRAAKKCAVFWSANMSLGIAVLKKTIEAMPLLAGFEFQIIEAHHIHKKDKPSGTAIVLQKQIEKNLGRKIKEPISIREGEIIGVHQIIAYSPEEVLFFEHRAVSRTLFAKGVLAVCKWIHSHTNGYYEMDDFIKEMTK